MYYRCELSPAKGTIRKHTGWTKKIHGRNCCNHVDICIDCSDGIAITRIIQEHFQAA